MDSQTNSTGTTSEECCGCGGPVPLRADGTAPALCASCFSAALQRAVRGFGLKVATF